ncbi:MAG: hypothetical protein HZB15_06760 [Actinobacteria bacterium]|nr:hypothetical protein [Actinomycetota bacterium]
MGRPRPTRRDRAGAATVAAAAAPLYAAGGPTALFFCTAALTAGALTGGVRLSHAARPVEQRVPGPAIGTVPAAA